MEATTTQHTCSTCNQHYTVRRVRWGRGWSLKALHLNGDRTHEPRP